MREILFKAKRIDNGEWVKGGIWTAIHYNDNARETAIVLNGLSRTIVDTETLCEFSSIYDKNFKMVCENDICIVHCFYEDHDTISLGAFENETEFKGLIVLEKLGWAVKVLEDNKIFKNDYTYYLSEILEDPEIELEVIGNKFDNPELLEKE